MSKGKEAADRGTMTGEHQLPLKRLPSAPPDLPEESRAEAPSPGTTEGAVAVPVQMKSPQTPPVQVVPEKMM